MDPQVTVHVRYVSASMNAIILLHSGECCSAGTTERIPTCETGYDSNAQNCAHAADDRPDTDITFRRALTQFDEHFSLQLRDLFGGLVQGAAEPHLGTQELQSVADHVVDVDGERVVFGPHVDAFLPPDVTLQKHEKSLCHMD